MRTEQYETSEKRRTVLVLAHIISVHYYNNVTLLEVKNFIMDSNSKLTFDEEFKAYLFYEKNKSLIDELYEIITYEECYYSITKEPYFPVEDLEKAKRYYEQKITRCKFGSDKYLETIEIIDLLNEFPNKLISNYDFNSSGYIYELNKYIRDVELYEKYIEHKNKKDDIDQKLSLTIADFYYGENRIKEGDVL